MDIDLSAFLESVALLTNEDNETKEDKNKVSLMTIHSAKGLEFRNIYIVGVEERLFPSEMSGFSRRELEEERRLFYVAITRAEKELVISYTKQRYKWGQLDDCEPSRFIKDINPEYIDSASKQTGNDFEKKFVIKKTTTSRKRKYIKSGTFRNQKSKIKNFDPMPKNKKMLKITSNLLTSSNLPTNFDKIIVGTNVEHRRFGYGKVSEIEGERPNIKATINFRNKGEKKLLLKFAKLKII